MKKPPFLTKTQRELIPFFITGCTHAEISADLKIPEHEVRQELRQVLDKFGRNTLRDVIDDLISYQRAYGTQRGAHQFYIERTDAKLVHGAARNSAVFTRYQSDLIVHGPLTQIHYRMWIAADIVAHTLNGQPTEPSREFMGQLYYDIDLDPPIEAGQTYGRHLMFAMENVFLEEQPQFHIVIADPTAEITFEMEFDPSRPLRKAWVQAEMSHLAVEVPPLCVSKDRLHCSFHMKEPEVGLRLMFMWDWDS